MSPGSSGKDKPVIAGKSHTGAGGLSLEPAATIDFRKGMLQQVTQDARNRSSSAPSSKIQLETNRRPIAASLESSEFGFGGGAR